MDINIYLSFDGRCAEAFDFYARVLGGTIEAKHAWGESPDAGEMPPEEQGKIMHAQLRVGERVIMGADAPAAWQALRCRWSWAPRSSPGPSSPRCGSSPRPPSSPRPGPGSPGTPGGPAGTPR